MSSVVISGMLGKALIAVVWSAMAVSPMLFADDAGYGFGNFRPLKRPDQGQSEGRYDGQNGYLPGRSRAQAPVSGGPHFHFREIPRRGNGRYFMPAKPIRQWSWPSLPPNGTGRGGGFLSDGIDRQIYPGQLDKRNRSTSPEMVNPDYRFRPQGRALR